MGKVLVSFIGVGRQGEGASVARSGYSRTRYQFPAEPGLPAREEQTSLLGAGLVRWMALGNQPICRWLVLGTPQSQWADLLEAVPEAKQESLLDVWSPVRDAVVAKNVTPELLARWEAALNECLAPLRVYCRITGPGDTEASQQAIWHALASTVNGGDHVVLDITHGYRHLPVLAAFMLQPLRWVRNIKQVDLYYGAFEMSRDEPPVLRLPLCNTMQVAAEAAATFRYTGNFAPLADCLDLPDETRNAVREAAFRYQTNRLTPDVEARLLERLERALPEGRDALLQPLLRDALHWSRSDLLADSLRRRVNFARNHGDYFRAVALLWEGILIAGQRCYPDLRDLDPLLFTTRQQVEDYLHGGDTSVFDYNERGWFKDLEHLRNAVLHGSSGDMRPEARRALLDEERFNRVLDNGGKLLKKLIRLGNLATDEEGEA